MAFFSGLKNLFAKTSRQALTCTAVIAAAGSSLRMGSEDKLFIEICGAPVLAHTLIAFQKSAIIGEIIVVSREESLERVCELCKQYGIDKATKVMIGGKTRLDSVMNGVFAVSKDTRLIAIHDGARPCVDSATIEAAVAAAGKYQAAAPAVKIYSTLKRVRDGVIVETVDREEFAEIQTPQVFTADLIKAALTKARDESVIFTDDCGAVEHLGFPVRVTQGSSYNIKITTFEDIAIAEAILNKCKILNSAD